MELSDSPIQITGTLQRQAWLERSIPPVEQLSARLWSIPVVMPDNPLRYVVSYALAARGGLTLIDSGWASDAAWDALTAGLTSIGASVTDVHGVLVTHMHLDHLGLAGRVREASGAWVALHPADANLISRPDYRDLQLALDGDVARLQVLGASAAEAHESVNHSKVSRVAYAGLEPDRLLADGEFVDVPSWHLRAVHTPGHTPGHTMFVDEDTDTVFAGDHILPRITPNISVTRGVEGNPLGDYLTSLQATAKIVAREIYPAHEWRFTGLPARVEQLLTHHQERSGEIVDLLGHDDGLTPWEVAPHLTWSRPWSHYQGRTRMQAVTETAAHLVYLAGTGRVTVRTIGSEGSPRYFVSLRPGVA